VSSNTKKYYRFERREVLSLLPNRYSKVLEIGCGEGAFRENLDQENEYWGIEPVESIAKIAKDKLDKVFVGDYQSAERAIPDNYFDLVICNDVIEHMSDYGKFLQSIKSKINKDGCLVASVPNVRYIRNLRDLLIKKDWRYTHEGILDRTHLRFFTKKSLIRTLSNNSFSIDRIVGINPYLPKSLLKRAVYSVAVYLFGTDTRYLQFGVRIRNMRASDE